MTIRTLDDAVVIVTGASSGIGEAAARALHAAGAHPVLAARRADRLHDLSTELGNALALPTDVTLAEDVDRLVQSTIRQYGRIDGLINNAGVSSEGNVADVDLDQLRRTIEINVLAPVALMQGVLPTMQAAGRGTIVNVSSGTTRRVAVGLAPYASTKAAINTLTLAARAELAESGVDVSLLVPFITATEFGGGMFSGPDAPTGDRTPHSAKYVAAVMMRMLQTGEERVDLFPGPEDWSLAELPA